MRDITIYDIAERLNIAPSTVSRGLKGHHTVSVKTQKKIADTAKEMGYQLNTFASGLRTRKTNTLGVIVPKLNSNFVAEVLAGIEKVTNDHGFNLIITQSLENRDKEVRNIETMLSNRVDGLIMSLSNNTEDTTHLASFFEKNIPVLFFDRVPQPPFPSISINNNKAGYLITKHLISKGAKRIAHIGGSHDINIYADRFKGYLQAHSETGIKWDESLLIETDLDEKAGQRVAYKIIQLKADGIFAANDMVASSCMNALKQLGVYTPNDILVAGFNNDIISRNVTPQLTTIHYPAFEMGEIAAQAMIDHLLNKTLLKPNSPIILNSELIVRESTEKQHL